MMTWEELVKKAKTLGYKKAAVQLDLDGELLEEERCLYKDGIWFYQNGSISASEYDDDDGVKVSTNRTVEQMWQIMEALK